MTSTRYVNRASDDRRWVDERPDLTGVHILVMDGEEDTRELLSAMFELCNARITLTSSTDEALETLRAVLHVPPGARPGALPDVLVSDIGRFDDGDRRFIEAVVALVGAHGAKLPSIAITTDARLVGCKRVVAAGFSHCVVKPIEPFLLMDAVADVLATHRT